MNKEKYTFCFVFAMGIESHRFLKRVEIKKRWKVGHATHRAVFFEGDTFLVIRSGIGFQKALEACRSVNSRPEHILSVGTCGALTEELLPGNIVLASETIYSGDPSVRVKCSGRLLAASESACSRLGLKYRVAPLVTSDKAVFLRSEREKLKLRCGAEAVDMESHAIGIGAASIGSPFGVIRVVSDGINSPPLPDSSVIKNWKNRLHRLPENVGPLLAWWKFLKAFNASIKKLDGPLIELTRTIKKSNFGEEV
jgi:adenosylhomocysteine nucleosidase